MKSYVLVLLSITLQGCTSARANDMNDMESTITVRSIRSDVQDVHVRPDEKFIDKNYSYSYRVDANDRDPSAYDAAIQLRSTLLHANKADDRAALEYSPVATIEVSQLEGTKKFVTDGCYAQDVVTGEVIVLGADWRSLVGTLSAPHAPGPVECP